MSRLLGGALAWLVMSILSSGVLAQELSSDEGGSSYEQDGEIGYLEEEERGDEPDEESELVRLDRPWSGSRPITLQAHAGLIWYGPGLAAGLRVGLPLMKNGFVPSINNAIYLHLGADFYYARYLDANLDAHGGAGIGIPIALHWEFYFDARWSAYAELGVSIYIPPSFVAGGDFVDRLGGWIIGAVGGKWHASDRFALMLTLGTPYTVFGAVLSF